jgi:hypothetical protein
MIEYQNLILEYKNSYFSSFYTKNLAIQISKYSNKTIEQSISYIKKSIKNSSNPVKFLRIIEKYLTSSKD